MKSIFAGLLCGLLATANALATSGGPVYGGNKTNVVGTYAGVLEPAFCPIADPAQCPGFNSIAVFSLSIPGTGTGSGDFTIFSAGRVFSGTISAVGDPKDASVKGILDASYNYNLQRTELDKDGQPHVVSIPVTATANGPLKAKANTTTSRTTLSSSTRLKGTATLNISGGYVTGNGEPVINQQYDLTVNGFKQSNTPAASTSTNPGG